MTCFVFAAGVSRELAAQQDACINRGHFGRGLEQAQLKLLRRKLVKKATATSKERAFCRNAAFSNVRRKMARKSGQMSAGHEGQPAC